jgi:hypothetical protein
VRRFATLFAAVAAEGFVDMSLVFSLNTNDRLTGDQSQRSARHGREFWRLAEAMRLVIPRVWRMVPLGEDDAVYNLAMQYGLGRHDLVPLKVLAGGEYAVVIGVPTRVWYHQRSKARLLLLKADLKRASYHCILAAERVFRRQPRLRNLELLEIASETITPPASQISVMQTVLENGGAPILDCAGLIDGPRPIEGVLSLVAAGQLRIDLSQAIGPGTMVYLPSDEVA